MEVLKGLDISLFVEYLNNHPNFINIAIQISDQYLDLSIAITRTLQLSFPNRFFFTIAETSYGQCCADEVAALHLKADIIYRIGKSCFTSTQTVPVFFSNFQKNADKDGIIKALSKSREMVQGKKIIVIKQ